ncbi:hypothetical protein [Streptomyces sp. NPDC051561]|uniref:hypothetical protein n=1 Tax=Streptomyces sp. NPDC051561 TaxID=3365658 RepID=UPI003788B5C0
MNRTRPPLDGGRPMIRAPRAALAVRAVMVARAVSRVAPGAATVQTTPVYVETPPRGPRIATHVYLADVLGRPLPATPDAHRAAYAALTRAFPAANWATDEHRYDVRRGELTLHALDIPGAIQ